MLPPPQAMFQGVTDFFRRETASRVTRDYAPQVEKINALEPIMRELTDGQLRDKTQEFKNRVAAAAAKDKANGGKNALDGLLVEAFAVVREASKRVLGLRPFDVQLIGGMVLHEGKLAEMRTGEGKTLVAVLPAYLNALEGKGVHIVTVNDYLARRDSEWVGQVHKFLGLDVGLVQASMAATDRYKAYHADVTYVTNSELGFDYLRDNLTQVKAGLVMRDFNFAVVDEVDSILIDEARTPIIISGTAEAPSEKYIMASELAAALVKGEKETEGVHYKIDEKQKSVLMTEEGYEAAENCLGVADLYDPKEQWASYVINAVKAKEFQTKDVNYIVRKGEIIIVDEFTGRTMPGRRWSDGLHQAIEAKEGLKIQNESVTQASISYQSLFRTFNKLAGMTGTASTEADEFSRIYNLSVVEVPTNKPISRTDNSDVVFSTRDGKWRAVVKEVKRMHEKGRPLLVGTTSVEQSEDLSAQLKEIGLKHQLLNAKPENVEREAETVGQSGRKGTITIATNMAGRGTDIILGGNPDYMARLRLRSMLLPEVVNQLAALEGEASKGKATPPAKTWAVAPTMFPCDLSPDTLSQAKEAVVAAKEAWGSKMLEELDAEERLSFACEKAATNDRITLLLRSAFKEMQREYKMVTDAEKVEVVELGGLHVVGTERHEARRVDNQLRGRSGRQGDPGSTRFFLSLEDNMLRIFGGDRVKGLMNTLRIDVNVPIESSMLTKSLDNAQMKVESYFFDQRKQLFDYDQVLNTQRENVYSSRRTALLADDLRYKMIQLAEKTADDILEANIDLKMPPENWKLDVLCNRMITFCKYLGPEKAGKKVLTPELVQEECDYDFEEIRYYLRERMVEAYDQKVKETSEVAPGLMQEAQRYFLLDWTDRLWQEHLQAMSFLQKAIGLRGYGQKDPLTEYKLLGYRQYLQMTDNVRRNVIFNVFQFDPSKAKMRAPAKVEAEAAEPQDAEKQIAGR